MIAICALAGLGTTSTLSAMGTASGIDIKPLSPGQFLQSFSAAIRDGNTGFLLQSLDTVVLKHFGVPSCRAFVATIHDPTAVYSVISVGKARRFTYAAPGFTAVVTDVVTIKVHAVRDGAPFTATIHLAESGHPAHFSWFTNCAPMTQYAGTYSGTWTDTTFSSGGPIQVVIGIDGTGGIGSPVNLQLTLGGNVFGASAPPAQTFTGSVQATGLSFTGSSPIFGNVTWTLSDTGAFTATGMSVPGGNVSNFKANGSISGPTLSASFQISLLDGMTAVGSMKATKAS